MTEPDRTEFSAKLDALIRTSLGIGGGASPIIDTRGIEIELRRFLSRFGTIHPSEESRRNWDNSIDEQVSAA